MLPIAGLSVAVLLVLAHLGGGAVLVAAHLGLRAVLANVGVGASVAGLAVIGVLILLHLPIIFGSLAALAMWIRKRTRRSSMTTGTTLHQARSYDRQVALLTLGRARALREQTIALARIEPGDAVLDVGCGTGDLTMLASVGAGAGGRTVGIDASPEMIAEARRKAVRAGAAVDYQVAAVEALPFPDATFDVVLSSLMMHHLPDELKPRALAEVRRALKPDGRLLIVDFRRPTTFRERLALPFLLHHRHAVSDVHGLVPLLTAAGFVAVEIGETNYGPVGFARARAGRA